MAKQEVENTIKFYESLVSEFPTPESWAVNILEASKRLTSEIAQTNFYRYLFAPASYSFQAVVKTVGDEEEEKYNKLVEEFDRNNLQKVKIYKNGRDMNIVYLPNKSNACEETKSVDYFPSQIQSAAEKQVPQHETGNVRRGEIIQEEEQKIDD